MKLRLVYRAKNERKQENQKTKKLDSRLLRGRMRMADWMVGLALVMEAARMRSSITDET